MRFACWLTKATNTHEEYVIPIAFPWQQLFRERASILRLHLQCMSLLVCLCLGLELTIVYKLILSV